MKSENFLIHLGPNMTNDDRDELQDIMAGLIGVISAHYTDENKLELVVNYNSEKNNKEKFHERILSLIS